MRAVGIAVNGIMMLFGVGVVAGLVRGTFTLHVAGFRAVAATLAVAVACSLLKVASGWSGRLRK